MTQPVPADTAPDWMPDDVLRQFLGEFLNNTVADILGWTYETVKQARKRLDVPTPWADRPQAFLQAACRVARARWSNWQQSPPAPISPQELEQLILAEMARKPERVRKVPPLIPAELLVKVRAFHSQQKRWPTVGDMAARLDRQPAEIEAAVEVLRRRAYVDLVDGRITPVEHIVQAGPVITYRLTPEEIAARYGPPRPTQSRIRDDNTIHKANPPVAPQPNPVQEVQHDMAAAVPAAVQDPSLTWPLPPQMLLDLVEEIKHTGGWPVPVLARRFGVSSTEVNAAIKAAREAMEAGQDAPVAQPAEPSEAPQPEAPLAEAPAPITEPAPAQAESSAPKSTQRSGRPSKRPSDDVLLAEVDEIVSRGGRVGAELTAKYGVSEGALFTWIGDARERAGLPRRMLKSSPRSATAPAKAPVVNGEPTIDMGVANPPAKAAEASAGSTDEADVPVTVQVIKDLQQRLRDAETEIANKAARIADLMETIRANEDQIATLKSEIAALTQTITQAAEQAHTPKAPLLLIMEGGRIEFKDGSEEMGAFHAGDHLALHNHVDGRIRAQIWEAVATGTHEGRYVIALRLLIDTATLSDRKAA